MVQIGDGTPIKLGFLITVLVLFGSGFGGAVWWASAMESKAGMVESSSTETKTILLKMSDNMTKGLKDVTTELRESKESLQKLMHAHSIILERTKVQIKGLKNRCSKIEERQIKILKGH